MTRIAVNQIFFEVQESLVNLPKRQSPAYLLARLVRHTVESHQCASLLLVPCCRYEACMCCTPLACTSIKKFDRLMQSRIRKDFAPHWHAHLAAEVAGKAGCHQPSDHDELFAPFAIKSLSFPRLFSMLKSRNVPLLDLRRSLSGFEALATYLYGLSYKKPLLAV